MKRSLIAVLLGAFLAAPVLADDIEYPTDAALLRPVPSVGLGNTFAPTDSVTSDKTDSLSGNKVTVTSSAPGPLNMVVGGFNMLDTDEVGGPGTGEGNQVFIKADLGTGSFVYGGYAASAKVTGNRVEITAWTDQVYGAYVHSGSGAASGNYVLLYGGPSLATTVYGGYQANGNGAVTGNTVEINGASVDGNVYGGQSNTGAATGNTVIISDSLVDGDIYGGHITASSSATATGNTVSIGGSSGLGASGFSGIVGGLGGIDSFTGNTLKLENYIPRNPVVPTPISIVRNFAFYEFRVSNDSGPLMIHHYVDFTGSLPSVLSAVAAVDLAPGAAPLQQQKIPLICVTASGYFTGTISNNGATLNSSTGYDFKLSQEDDPSLSGNCVYAIVIPALSSPAITPASTSASFSVTSNIGTLGAWKLLSASETCPATVAELLADPDSTGNMQANTGFNVPLSNLTPGTNYKFCFAAGNYDVYSPAGVLELPFTTLSSAPPPGPPPTPDPTPTPDPVFSDGDELIPGNRYTAPPGNSSFCLGASGSAPVTIRIDNVPYTITPRAENTCLEIFESLHGRTLILDSGIADIGVIVPGVPLLEARNGDLVMNKPGSGAGATIRATLDPVCTSTRITVLEGKVDAPEWITSPMPATGCPADALTPKQGSFTVGDGKLACNPSALVLKGTYAKLGVQHTQELAAGQQVFIVAGHPLYGWYQNNGIDWMPLGEFFLPFSTASKTGPHTTAPVHDLDIRGIPWVELYTGHGKDADEMMMNKRYCGIFQAAP
ncbi:MAG: hypothetical protein FWD77_05195 [Betaproteobacteria bacterium]|nr:hypothetical protein [Betaproteobacteria bacterium]